MDQAAGRGGLLSGLVVLVRDFGVNWVEHTAALVRRGGGTVALVTGPDPRAQARLARAVDQCVVVPDPTDPTMVSHAVDALAAGRRVAAVLSITDGCVAVAAQVAEWLGLRRTPAAPIVEGRNKFLVRQRLARAGLPNPGFALLAGPEQASRVAAEVGLPAVIKPLNGTGSHLVRRVKTGAQLAEAYREIVAGLARGPLAHLYRRPVPDGAGGAMDPGRVLLVERTLVGREYCLDLVVRDGGVIPLPVVDKFLMDEQFFELGFVCPPFDLPAAREAVIRDVAVAAVQSLAVANTMAHVEVIDDARLGPTVVEVNVGRPGGMGPALLNRLVTGVDPTEELLAAHCGAPRPRATAGVSFPLAAVNVFASAAGRVRAVHGLAELVEHPDVVATIAAVAPGDVITADHEVDIAGLVLAGFTDQKDLVETCHELRARVWAEVDPG